MRAGFVVQSAVTMGQPQMILDYAGPRKRSRFRMASRSVIACRWDGAAGEDGVVIVSARLEGQEQATLFIGAAALMLVLAAGLMIAEAARSQVGFVVFQSSLIVAGVALIPVVVQQSWRRTILAAGDGVVTLTMGGPLSR